LNEEFKSLWEASSKDLEATVFGITNTIKTSFKSACQEAKIEDFRFHDCPHRHNPNDRIRLAATEVMKITGHSQLKTFLRYLNVTSKTTAKVAFRLGRYLVETQSLSETVSQKIN